MTEVLKFCHFDFFGTYFSNDSNYSFCNSFWQFWKDASNIDI